MAVRLGIIRTAAPGTQRTLKQCISIILRGCFAVVVNITHAAPIFVPLPHSFSSSFENLKHPDPTRQMHYYGVQLSPVV